MLPIFYRPEQSSTAATGYSPSAGKPALAVADWMHQDDIKDHIQIETFNPVGGEVLCGAHDPSYVEGVLCGDIENGFGNHDLDLAESLRYTVGSMVAAAKHVLTANPQADLRVAVSPTSGFHHAGYDFGGGFCTFNGLIATAVRMKELGLVERVLIADFDQHFGNGTQHCIEALGLDWISHITASKSYKDADGALFQADLYRKGVLDSIDLVLFQAGADIHVDDPLGGLLTTEEMQLRDRRVLLGCEAHKVPVVVNLAGGYKRDEQGTIEPVLALHRQTIREILKKL